MKFPKEGTTCKIIANHAEHPFVIDEEVEIIEIHESNDCVEPFEEENEYKVVSNLRDLCAWVKENDIVEVL
jgi:hypothetical protein